MQTFSTSLRRASRSLGLVTVGVLSTLGALSLTHVGPASAQSPGVNLAQLVATVNGLKIQQQTDEQTITSQGSTITSLQSTVTSQGNTITSQGKTITAQASQITALQTLIAPLTLSTDLTRSDGRTNTELTITGVNLHLVNGLNGTGTTNGLGNLIVGYDEPDPNFSQARTGSHNLVVGIGNNYLSYGGLVAGQSNLISAPYASVTGGYLNVASSGHASVSGGRNNTASANYATVSGGGANTASGNASAVSGGYGNTASGANVAGRSDATSVSGGQGNTASGGAATISGGRNRNQAASYGWTAGSESGGTFSDYVGNFRSP